jgi:hypothetical protein
MEDFIFDDDVDDVGAEVEAHCPKCKADTTHVIISKYEDEIRRVQCNPCGDVHAYRKPTGESEEEAPAANPKKKVKAKPTWEQIMAKSKKQPRPYALGEYFKELEILSHPKFGVGYVTENIGDDKIEVTFQADKRVLVHNRKGLNLPVAMLRPLVPTDGKGKKKPEVKGAAPKKPAPPVVVAKAKPKAAARPAGKKPVKIAAPQPKRAAKAASHKPAPKRPVKKAARAAAPVRAKAPAKKLKKSR